MLNRLVFGEPRPAFENPAPVGGCGYRGIPGASNPTFQGLCDHMRNKWPITLVGPDGKGYHGNIVAIEMEDGSGNKWNVTISDGGEKKKIFLKTQ